MKKILVIEDEQDIRENISTFLKEEGFKVHSAKDGFEGIALAKKEIPDLIVCDIMMPEIDGYFVFQELLQYEKMRLIPFIFLTAKVERADLRRGMELGADDYIFKPFKTEELLNSINSRLNKIETLKAGFSITQDEQETKKYSVEDKIFINTSSNPQLIKISEILFIAAERQYTSIKLIDSKSYLIRKSITRWEEQLPEKSFLRIHRSSIINLDYVIKIEKRHNSSFMIYLKNTPTPFDISKRYASKIREHSV